MSEFKYQNSAPNVFQTEKKKDKTFILVIVLSVVVAGLVAAGVFVLLGGASGSKKNTNYYEIATEYYEDGNYEAAIPNFWKAIDQNEFNVDAYEKLGDCYIRINDYSMAAVVFERGFKTTKSSLLKNLYISTYVEYKGEYPAGMGDRSDGIDSLKIDKKQGGLSDSSLNKEIMMNFENYTYASYQRAYGLPTVTSSGGVFSVKFGRLNATLYFYNTNKDENVINQSALVPYDTKYPNEIELDTLEMIFPDIGDGMSIDEVRKLPFDSVDKSIETGNRYRLECRYNTLTLLIECDKDGKFSADAYNRIITSKVDNQNQNQDQDQKDEDEETLVFTITGSVSSATTGEAVEGASLELKTVSGRDVKTAYTDAQGNFEFDDVEEGDYYIEISKDGYISIDSDDFTVSAENGNIVTHFIISEELEEGEIRIVLDWGEYPTDLDLYAIGTSSDGSDVETWFGHMNSYDKNSNLVAELDIDDTNGFGPETITITDIGGTYEIIVNDFTDSGNMDQSSARVTIYMPGESPIVMTVGGSLEDEGNTWRVGTISGGSFRAN